MQIKSSLALIVIVFFSLTVNAQRGTYSPYSFYGIGSQSFKATTENRSMAGLSVFSDSIHLNLQNPAAYADLKLTAFTGGLTVNITDYKSENSTDNFKNTTIDYFAIGIPTNIGGFGIGLRPTTSVGYDIQKSNDNQSSVLRGRGGLNTTYLSWGYSPLDGLKLGASVNYNFGTIENKSLIFRNQVQYGSRDLNETNVNGFSFDFGGMYDYEISKFKYLRASARYQTGSSINAENLRRASTILLANDGSEVVVDELVINNSDTQVTLSEVQSLGIGFGERLKWFLGAEYVLRSAPDFSSLNFNTPNNVSYTDANEIKLGGFYTPRYNAPRGFYNRLTYRAGIRYQDTGMRINNQDVEEFGISFGVGIPAGRYFTNANIGVEYGRRGTTSNGLIKENFLSIFISFSFNDKWFVERRFN
ncbi:lipid outer membrane transport protein FadL-like protein [Psychroflexus planctonicus]|uniref:Membrane protein n=1 Tax=Psychroflexus planctonicus TaxID=1526575 RepID=A0ABQ1SEL3_9FLAO|nr:lipid outer membrane transport protein FadL-like protein [Psychroflexus planctonicus]GGE34245.1 membrane protein [Psychroflexus planctonicus]